MPLMASHTVLVMTSAEKLGPGRSRTPPPPSLVARVYRRRAARGEPGSRRCLPLCEALPYTPCARAGPDLVSRVPRATIEAVITSLSLIHISEPTRLGMISYAVFCLK